MRLVLLGAFALGNAGMLALAARAWQSASTPVVAMPCHGGASGDTAPGDTGGCQWASPASCCDSPQTVDTQGSAAPMPLAVSWGVPPAAAATVPQVALDRAFEPPLPVPRNARVLRI